jgi:hypothetical protein
MYHILQDGRANILNTHRRTLLVRLTP